MRGLLTVFVLLGCAVVNGQTTLRAGQNAEQNFESASFNPLLNPDQSSVFMEFRKVGKCPPPQRGESQDRLWLALRNNTRWRIIVRANGVENECYGDASPFYRVEANGSKVPDGPIPFGHWFDVASLLEIGPGEELTFSVPKFHLDPGLSIRVDFEFSWEKNGRYTRHSSYFSYWDLPVAFHDREKEKRLKCANGLCLLEPEEIPVLPDPPLLPHLLPRK
jgi:hypothetical protein